MKHSLASAIMRLCYRSTATAFEQWKEYVTISKVLRLQRQHAVEHMQQVRLQQYWTGWQSAIACKQLYKVAPLT